MNFLSIGRATWLVGSALFFHSTIIAQTTQSCAGLVGVEAVTANGWCLGIIANSEAGLRMPRHVAWLGKRSLASHYEIDLLVVDMGSWEVGKGRLLQLTWNSSTKKVMAKELLRDLDRPHGLQKGPDGVFYLGEATKISKFTWGAGKVSKLQTVLANLPAEGRHPLKALVFGSDGHLYFNVGAATDRCSGTGSKLLPAKQGLPHCTEMEGTQPQAAVYVAKMKWPKGEVVQIEPFALGLRNSMGLAAHASGTLLQAENNIDFSDEKFPPEEINVL